MMQNKIDIYHFWRLITVVIVISACKVSVFNFPEKDHHYYTRYNGTLPELSSLTVCAWVKPGNQNDFVKGSIISYCTKTAKDCNTILVWLRKRVVAVHVNSEVYAFKKVPTITISSFLCIFTDMNTLKYYINGSEYRRSIKVRNKENIPGGGVLILGNDQDGEIDGNVAGPPRHGQGFHGEIRGLRLWERVMNQAEIRDLYLSRCNCGNDSIITFNESNSILQGNITATYNVSCD